jgi:hypothetical protein
MKYISTLCAWLALLPLGAYGQTLLTRTYDPSLGTLPTAQGWSSTGSAPSSIIGGSLYENNTLTGGAQQWTASAGSSDFNTVAGAVADIDLRVVSGSYEDFSANWRTSYNFDFTDKNGLEFDLGISSSGIIIGTDENLTYAKSSPFIPFDTTSAFHDYQVAINASGVRVSIDGNLIAAATLPLGGPTPPDAPNSVYFGPAEPYGTSETYVNSVSYTVPGVPIATAGSNDNAYVDSTRSDPGPGSTATIAYQNLDVLSGGSYTLGANEVLDLNNGAGTLDIHQGGVFTGNGIVDGNIVNAGLVRIPIVSLGNVSNVHGGFVPIITPAPTPGEPIVITAPMQPITIQPGTIVGFSNSTGTAPGGGGGTGGGGGVGGAGGGAGEQVRYVGSLPSVQGTLQLDASLEVTGDFTQTATGATRFFVGGTVPGVTYSQLIGDSTVHLAGELQIVLEPELQNFLPYHDETFDLITSTNGITIDPAGISLISLVTDAGSSYLASLGVSQSAFDSGISSDPDSLMSIDPQLWSYALVNGGKTLEVTYLGPTAVVPEPAGLSLALFACAGAIVQVLRRRRWRGVQC